MTVPADRTNWVTLRDAARATNASVPALRRWYREGLIQSLTVPGMHGDQRLVDLDEVVARASVSPNIGRRRAAGRDERDAVTEALLDQVAAMAMEIAELRERVSAIESARTSPS
ncbi:MAG: hypothetical protein Q8K63_02755 [Acidimicrobiales bacterium]|nr:hypothetical protein [Acidimicrobiales bacterium]